jgi:hypothetical protein
MNENEKSGYESAKREITNESWTKQDAVKYLDSVIPMEDLDADIDFQEYVDFDRGHRLAISEFAGA